MGQRSSESLPSRRNGPEPSSCDKKKRERDDDYYQHPGTRPLQRNAFYSCKGSSQSRFSKRSRAEKQQSEKSQQAIQRRRGQNLRQRQSIPSRVHDRFRGVAPEDPQQCGVEKMSDEGQSRCGRRMHRLPG